MIRVTAVASQAFGKRFYGGLLEALVSKFVTEIEFVANSFSI